MLEIVGRFARQVVPSVVATIIAALLISVLNYTFSQKVGTVKTNGIASLSSAPNTTTDFVFAEPQRQPEKAALVESPKEQKEQMHAPKPARAAAPARAVHETPDALEPARAALARNRPAPPPHVEVAPMPAPVIVTGPPAPPVAAVTPMPPALPAAPPESRVGDAVPRPPADIPQAAPAEVRSAHRGSLIGEIFDAIRPSTN